MSTSSVGNDVNRVKHWVHGIFGEGGDRQAGRMFSCSELMQVLPELTDWLMRFLSAEAASKSPSG